MKKFLVALIVMAWIGLGSAFGQNVDFKNYYYHGYNMVASSQFLGSKDELSADSVEQDYYGDERFVKQAYSVNK